ncbi:sigma 54-interacting transcriptional regulator [Sessilibacter corallicola]|uniref:sigma 54-interacting transcriptional regulator n=1 Tax=Sessilibacter corallicola TaxID=2904075 RepID=UPI001E4F95AB|nr:sigma 54-interacting transcriptional regulator [Sessilibacter corallicola]MCE2027822.1 sigma 54-interacting transcriptional regulator [Sessilibacter corallicola]
MQTAINHDYADSEINSRHNIYEQLFLKACHAQLIIDPLANSVLSSNQSAQTLFHLTAEALQKVSASQLFTPSLGELIVLSEEALAEGHAWNGALAVAINHQEITLEITVTAIEYDQRKVLLFVLIDSNDLQHKREKSDANQHYQSGMGHWNKVTRVFQEFERENQLILDAAGEGIYGVDVNGITTFMNPAAENILGYRAEELAGTDMHKMIHHSHLDGSHFDSCDCPILEAFRDGVVHTVEKDVFWSKSGQPVYVDYTSTPIKDNGVIVGAVIVFRDVTQKIADEQKLLSALNEVEQLKNRLELEKAYLQEEIKSEFNHHQIIGNSTAIKDIIQKIQMVAPTDATVLIHGESGTGKELIARAIHETSRRCDRPLIRVNCAAIPAELFESEFFGHIKGAFTGAASDRTGRFELADKGTLFLDEVGEIPLHLQSKLLRVLQEQQFERVGGSKTHTTDVRIIAATNKDLLEKVRQGSFREDLYFRLNVFPISSVPLRQRIDDIPLLAQHFLKRSSTRTNKLGLKIPLSELENLKNYSWPGNIRELENIIERQVILSQGEKLRFPELKHMEETSTKPAQAVNQLLNENQFKDYQRSNILSALEKCQGKVFGHNGAAELLGIKPTTLSSRIKKLKIDPKKFRSTSIGHRD